MNNGRNDGQLAEQQGNCQQETEYNAINTASETLLNIHLDIMPEYLFEYNELYLNAKYGNIERAKKFYG